MWQTWTAFGIMFGYLVDVAFEKVPDQSGIIGLNWRLMLGSVSRPRSRLIYVPLTMDTQAGVPAVIVALQVFFCPESPRWYMMKGRYTKAFGSLRQLRHTDLQAARDLYCTSRFSLITTALVHYELSF